MVKNLPAKCSISGSGRSLEEEMATHSSILAWRIPWSEEPGRLQSMGLQTVGHDSASEHSTHGKQEVCCLATGNI